MKEKYEQLEFDFNFEAIVCDEEDMTEEIMNKTEDEEEPEPTEDDKYKPKTAEEVYKKIYKTQEDIQKIADEASKTGWRKVSNICGTMVIKPYNERKPRENTGFELFTRRRTIQQITGQNLQKELLKENENVGNIHSYRQDRQEKTAINSQKQHGGEMSLCGNSPVRPRPLAPVCRTVPSGRSGRFNLYRTDADKPPVLVPDCSGLPVLSHFHEFDSLVQVQSACADSLVISCDTEFVTCAVEDCRIAVSFQFAVIDGVYLHEFVFIRCHPASTIELSFCLGLILDFLNIYQPVKGSDIIHFQACSKFLDGKPVISDFGYVDMNSARASAVYKYLHGRFIPELIPRGRDVPFVERSSRDWAYFHFATDFTKVHAIPVTLLCHFGRIDISGFCDCVRHMRRCSDVQGGLITMRSTNLALECHVNSSDWQHRSRHKYYPVRLSFADTMCHAPAGMKKLENLGAVVGVPKVDLEKIHSNKHYISHIHDLLSDDAVTFLEYSGTDAVVTLLYASALYGYNKSLPVTITSATAKYLRSKIMSFLSVTNSDDFNLKYRGLVRVNRGSSLSSDGRLLPVFSLEPVSAEAAFIHTFATNAYHGGYNGSSDIGDYSGVLTHDYDICSAYSSIMSVVPDIDWDNPVSVEIRNRKLSLDDFVIDGTSYYDLTKVGFFEVDSFSFPSCVAAPCFCCVDNGVPVYPLKSSSASGHIFVSAQDVYLALCLGASVHCKRGYFCNLLYDSDGNISYSLRDGVVALIVDRLKAKKLYGKKSLEELILKTMVNSFYGKIAQNVIDKRTWNAYHDVMESLGISSVTNPASACMITSYIRCILLAAYNQIVSLGYRCFSVTTDGFISDIPHEVLDSLDLFGFRDFLLNARKIIGDSDATSCFEIKHEQSDLLNFTTRGNISLSSVGVSAHNSFCTGFDKDSYDDRKALAVTVLSRTKRCPYTKSVAPKFKAILNNHALPIFMNETRHISMDFDLKRKPVRESMRTVTREIDGVSYEICDFSTVPFDTLEEFRLYRRVAESCRKTGCLRTLNDWNIFYARLSSDGSSVGKRVERHFRNSDGSDNLAWKTLTSVIMGYRLGFWDIPYLSRKDLSVAEKISWINTFNSSDKPFTENNWKDCRKKNRVGQMLDEDVLFDLLDSMQKYAA